MEPAREPVELDASPEDLRCQEEMTFLGKAYLGRLRRLLQLRSDYHDDLNQQGLWLLDRSAFTTYCDCVDLGVGFVAQEIIRRHGLEGRDRTHPALGHPGDPAQRRRL